jgi:hypothetical protein
MSSNPAGDRGTARSAGNALAADSPEVITHLASGQAGLMLFECLMLLLIEKKIFTVLELVNAVEIAIATKKQMVQEDEHREIAATAAGLLSSLANSLAAAEPKVSPR